MLLTYNMKIRKNNGISLVEVIVAASILTLIVTSIMVAITNFSILSNRALYQVKADFLLEEAAEAIQAMSYNSWDDIKALDGYTQALIFDAVDNRWEANVYEEGVNGEIDGFTRTFITQAVDRDANDDITESGTLDPGTRLVTVTINWIQSSKVLSRDLSLYIFDIYGD